MATANLSVGINTTQAKTDLQALKSFMQTQLSDMTLSINEKSLEASITRAMKGPSGNRGYRLVVDTAALKSDIQTAINDAARGAKAGVGSGGSIDATKLTAEFSKVQQQVSTLNAEIGKLSAVTPVAQATTATKQLGNAHKEATTHTKTHAAAMRDAHSAARGLASGFGLIWLTWGNVAPLLAGASLSHGFMQAMKAGSEFAYQLTFVKALGGETAESVRGIGNAALELSKQGLFGPVELANGLRTLSQAGLNATESMKALPVVLDLATVGEMNMKDAAITLVGVMTAFNLDKTDLTKIGDVFAKAAAVSQTSVEQMTQAMKTASVVGEQYGASMGDTATALTLLAKVNITGTAAGTSLRNMLKELYSPVDKSARIMKELGLSAKTATGELRPFPDVIFELQTKLKDFNKASQVKLLQGLFGERGAKEAIAMLSLTRAEWDKLNQTITESSGFMREVSAELEGTVKGSFKQAVNTLQVSLIEAYNNAEGAAGKLAGQLKETFGSTAFKETLESIVVGVVSLTNAIVAMAPALAMAAGGWLALRAAMIGATIWTSVSTALAGATLAIQTLGAVAAGTATTMTGASGLLAAARMLPGVMGAAGASLIATTGVLAPLAVAIGVAGTAWYLFRDRTVEAMQQSAEAVAQGAASMRNNLANILKDVHNLPAAMSRKAMDAQRQVLVDGQNNLLKQRETLKSQYGIKSDAEAEQFIAKATTTNSSGEVYTKTGAQYDAVSAYLKAKAAQREALRDFARVNQTVESVAASEVKPELTTNTGKLKDWNGGGAGGASAKELGRYETNRLKNVLKEQADIEKIYDAHYKRLVAVENASAQAGLITREEAENKVTQLTEEQTRVRLQINEGFHNHLKGMLATSKNMTASQKEQIEGEMERRGLLILELQEELSLKRELAKIASAGAEKKFQDNIDKNNVDLTRELELAKAAAYGKAKNPIDRARDNGETLVSNRYAQLMQEAVDARIRAEQSGDKASIDATAARLERLDLEVQQAKKYYGDQYAALAEYQQTGQYGWEKFWEKYQENATTAAKVVEESMSSVTKNIEDAFSDMFKTGTFDAKKMIDSILADIGRLVAKLAVADIGHLLTGKGQSSGSVLGEIFGSSGGEASGLLGQAATWIGGLFSAKGNAFTAQGVKAFAKGGAFSNSIVRQPTLFRFADGVGMMGEAGPEAIMPLTRDSQGRLGVRYEGREAPQRRSDTKVTNNNISVSVNAPGGDPAQVRRSGAAVAREVSNAVAMSGRYR